MKFNQISIRDAHLALSIDKFSEKFAGFIISFWKYILFDYDQVKFDEKSRNITSFITPLGFIRMVTLP